MLRERAGGSPLTKFAAAFFEPEIRAWRGEEPLSKVFWGYGVLASSILALFYAFALYQDRVATQQILLICLAGYTVWILVAVWQCSGNSKEPHLGMLARLLTVAWAVNAIMVLTFLQLGLVKTYLGF
jgi:hypothetical protein